LTGNEYFEELSRHHVVLMLSDYEGVPGSIIDGMSVGLVAVSLRYEGCEDLVGHGHNGLIVEDRAEGLESALQLLSGNTELWRVLSDNARRHICETYAGDRIPAVWEEFLSTLVRQNTGRGKINIPAKIRLPKTSTLLPEDRRKPGILSKMLTRISHVLKLAMLLAACLGCRNEFDMAQVATDKDVALEYLKVPFIQRPFDAYHLDHMPDAAECFSLLDSNGHFIDTWAQEQFYMAHLDSFHTIEFASDDYSKFLVKCLRRLWKIAEEYRGK
jgi:hypothetical protein